MKQERLERLGLVCRFKPVHLGHLAMLEACLEHADQVVVGLGSAGRYDLRNPFTAAESAEMLRDALGSDWGRVQLVEVPDLGHGPRWRRMVRRLFGDLDLFVSANGYVRRLMGEVYPLAHPLELVAPEDRVAVDGTQVRRAMALGEDWEALVPPAVATTLHRLGLPERFRREFGLATLAEALRTDHLTEEDHVLLGR
jgi:nicotinamide-nucleotide adenylyltransferase